jgi:phosphoribosylformylglycinamidine synthase
MKEQLILSSHDVSDGGLLLCLAEKMMGTKMGMKLSFDDIPKEKMMNFLFNESAGRIVVSVEQKNKAQFEKMFEGIKTRELGFVTNNESLVIDNVLSIKGSECLAEYKYLVEKKI